MTAQMDVQTKAAAAAAMARQALAQKIGQLTPHVEDDVSALVVLHLAQAYGHLAIEPPRTRGA